MQERPAGGKNAEESAPCNQRHSCWRDVRYSATDLDFKWEKDTQSEKKDCDTDRDESEWKSRAIRAGGGFLHFLHSVEA